MTRQNFIMAAINIVVDDLMKHDRIPLPEIIDGLKAYTKAAEIAAQAEGKKH